MGLEVVELIMEVEDEYGIELPDEEVSGVRTLGDLYECIVRRMGDRRSTSCSSLPLFYELRRAILEVVGGDPRAIRPRTTWPELIAAGREREIWKEIEARLGCRLPALVHTKRGERIILAIGGLASVVIVLLGSAVLLLFSKRAGASSSAFAVVFTIVALLVIGAVLMTAFKLASPFASVIPSSCQSLRDTCYAIARARRQVTQQPNGYASDREAWETLRTIVSEQLGVERACLKRETRFVEDLNVG